MNYPVTVEDFDRAMDIFGHDVPNLKENFVRKTLDVVKHEVVYIPYYVLDKNKVIVMSTDICFANTLQFLGTISQVKFGTFQHMTNKKKKIKLSSRTTVCRIYGARGFTVKVINADNQFGCLREDLMALGITLNVAVANEHVSEIESSFRVIKERAGGIFFVLYNNSKDNGN